MSTALKFRQDKITGMYTPTFYPDTEDLSVDGVVIIDQDCNYHYQTFRTIIEAKYNKEYLKVCAFYNKLFPSLKTTLSTSFRSSHNSPPMEWATQERKDLGTGLQANYLKQAIDQVTARIGNTSFKYKLKSDENSLLFNVYHDDVEKLLKKVVQDYKISDDLVVHFHDAAILAMSHVFIDPFTGELLRTADWEIGYYESEFNKGELKRILYRDFAYPVTELDKYTDSPQGWTEDELKSLQKQVSVDLCLYQDCIAQKQYILVNNKVYLEQPCVLQKCYLTTYCWDIGTKNTTVGSLFDMLYPIQREINKMLAKQSNLYSIYKGPVPVFSADSDIIVKQLTNTAGEVIFLDTKGRQNPADLMTVLEPTKLDPELQAQIEAKKQTMFEIAGIQNISMDLENYRSAASVIALNQMRDSGFQSQLTSLSKFTKNLIYNAIQYFADVEADDDETPPNGFRWSEVWRMLDKATFEITAVHENAPDDEVFVLPSDQQYIDIAAKKFVYRLMRGQVEYEVASSFSMDFRRCVQVAALKYVRLQYLDEDASTEMERLLNFLVYAFLEEQKEYQRSVA